MHIVGMSTEKDQLCTRHFNENGEYSFQKLTHCQLFVGALVQRIAEFTKFFIPSAGKQFATVQDTFKSVCLPG